MLMNSQFILDQAARFAIRLKTEAGEDRARQVTRAWQLAFSREPARQEMADALEFLSRQVEELKMISEKADAEKKEAQSKKDEKSKPVVKAAPAPELQALTNLCQALLSSNEFLYVD
jgi:predicted ATPase